MAISGNGKLIAAYSIGGIITIFQPNFVKIIDNNQSTVKRIIKE